ncbi:hypothetical protein ACFXG7_35980 [Nocardia tengchongensis]
MWQSYPLLRRCGQWVGASRRRRRFVAFTGLILAMSILPGCLGAIAGAQTDAGGGRSGNGALSWMNVRDSAGVNVSNYVFVSDPGDALFHLKETGLATVINLEFAGWMVIVITGIWLIGYVLSFQWLNLFAAPLRLFARVLTGELTLPVMLIAAATIGAFCVAWFVLRGHHTKATLQIVTMLAVALLGPMFLADPLSEVLAPDGWLGQGRDLGLSIAAGLNGDQNPDSARLVTTMQTELADNFARKPLQVWNFGHEIDDEPACRTVWNAGMRGGAGDSVPAGIQGCGDKDAYNALRHPDAEQIGAGLLVLLAGTLLLAFAAVLAVKIVRSALDSVYQGLVSIIGFAAGGFVYGPSQTLLVRSVVHTFFAAARMATEVVFLGMYVLFLSDLFRQARGQVMTVFVIGAIVEVVAISQLKRLTASFERGNDWVANRFAAGIQSGARGGGSAVGMGTVGARRHGLGVLGTLAAASTISSSPITEWLMNKTRTPLRPDAPAEKRSLRAQWEMWGRSGYGGANGWQVQNVLHRQIYADAAREGALAAAGIDTATGAAAGIQHAVDAGAGIGDLNAALQGAGFTDLALIRRAVSSWGIVAGNADDFVLSDKRLGHTVAAMQRVQNTANRLVRSGSRFKRGDADDVAADLATLQAAAYRFRRANEGGVTLDSGVPGGPQSDFVEAYMDDPSQTRLSALAKLANEDALDDDELLVAADLLAAGVNSTDARRMWAWVGNEHAKRVYDSVSALLADPADPQRMRDARRVLAAAQATDRWAPSRMNSPWKQLAPPGNNDPAGDWALMNQVAMRVRG